MSAQQLLAESEYWRARASRYRSLVLRGVWRSVFLIVALIASYGSGIVWMLVCSFVFLAVSMAFLVASILDLKAARGFRDCELERYKAAAASGVVA